MSALTVTAERAPSPTPSTHPVHIRGVAQRARRAVSMAGVTALLLGATLGLVQADPHVLASLLGGEPHPLALTLAGAGIIGLVGGLIAGLALRGRTGMLRWLVGVSALLVGLIGAEMAYGIVMRMPLRAALTSTNDGIEAAQIGIGAVTAVIGSLAGRKKNSSITANARTAASPAPAPARQPARSRRRRTSTHTSRSRTISRRTSRRASPSRTESSAPPVVVKKPRPKRRWLKRRQVNLGKQTTSICPYCLEEVLPNDPRGRVVCKICGTPHHRDCWEITGTCQVPHLQD